MELPQVDNGIGAYWFTWADPAIEIGVDRLYEERHQTHCEINVATKMPGVAPHLHRASFNLSSTQARHSLSKTLEARLPDVPWDDLLEQVCFYVLDKQRQGEPAVEVGDVGDFTDTEQEEAPDVYRLWPLLPEGESSLIYGDGASLKSMVAVLAALMVQLPHEAVGMKPVYGNVLYLDYETKEDTIGKRLRKLRRGLGIEGMVTIHYQRRSTPIAESLPELRRLIHQIKPALLVVDSVAWACNGDVEKQEPVTGMFTALRSLGTTNLLIGHVPKNNTDGKERTPFGSTFWRNGARSMWEARKTQEPGSNIATLGLYHRKVNDGQLFSAIGLQFTFEPSAIQVARVDVKRTPELRSGLSQKQQVLAAIFDGPMSVAEISQATSLTTGTIRPLLTTLKNEGKAVNLGGGIWARASERQEL